MQLRMFDNVGLDEYRRSIRIHADSEPIECVIDDVFANALGGIIVSRQRMPIDDAVIAVVRVLETHPVIEGSNKMAEVQLPRRPHAAKNSWPFHSFRQIGETKRS